MTKRFLTFLAFGLAVSVPSMFASTITLAPGAGTTSVPSNGAAPPPGSSGGTVVATTSRTVVNPSVAGVQVTITEDVVLSGGLYDFYYMFDNTSTTRDSFNTVSMTNYTGFTTAVAYLTGTGIVPSDAGRSGGGDTISFGFGSPSLPTLAPGDSTDWLEIDTNAHYYDQHGFAGAIDGGGFSGDSFYEPAVPEPVSMSLFGGGLALLGIARWRSKSKKA